MKKPIIVGISSCLLGEKVRFDGGHKRDNYICDFLADYVDFLPICPEVGMGMTIPRPAIRLIGDPDNPRLVEVKNNNIDYTELMQNYAHQTMPALQTISAYILKSNSPSCGWKRVKIYQEGARTSMAGQGVFAQVLQASYPDLPIEEEGRLNDPRLRENFIERLFIYHEWQELFTDGLTAAKLVDFHTRHKLTLMAHHPAKAKMLGQKIAKIDAENLDQIAVDYRRDLMEITTFMATPKKHANVLQHCLGYFKSKIDAKDKQELLKAIDDYRIGLLPLIVPITLLKHHLNHHEQPYLNKQSYINPYPAALMLRNHI